MTPISLLLRRIRTASKLRKRAGKLTSLKRLGIAGALVLGAHVIAMMAFESLDW